MFKEAVKRSSANQQPGVKKRVAVADSAVVVTAPRSESPPSVESRSDAFETETGQTGNPPIAIAGPAIGPAIAGPGLSSPSAPGRVVAVIESPSPGSNRERFMANNQPTKVSCDLTVAGLHNSSSRFSFQAIVLVVYPATTKPDRRHLQLIDARGSTGITVWNDNVSMFSASSVGQAVRFTKLSLQSHNGQRSLSMSRDSTVTFISSAVSACEESKWWLSLLEKPPLRIIDVHDQNENIVISVGGIVGTLSSETKRVKNEDKELMCMRITDRTGFIDVRSWNHSESEFSSFREKPILLKRVRVTVYAGIKIIELLDASGTQVLSDFAGAADLASYWSE
jgi:hypothetical protein